jgi:glycosyltransferase involved in cell wall biosynthesis
MKIAILSKALIVGAYRSKLTELAALPDMEVIAIVPPEWRDERGVLHLEPTDHNTYELIVTPIAFNGYFHVHYYPQLDRLLRRIRPDILHIDEEPYNLATYLALRSAQQVNAKTLFFSWQNIKRRYPPPFNWIERYTLTHVDACIAGNHDAQEVWRAKGYRGPIEIIPQFGVDPEFFSPQPSHSERFGFAQRKLREEPHPISGTLRVAQGDNEKVFVIGCGGRFVEEKGIDILLRALATLNGNWRAELLGNGPERTRLIDLAQQLHLSDRVRFLPWRPSDQLPDYCRSIDVLVLPSRTKPNWKEQFGRALVEAMACGVPVIGSNSGEIPNVIGDAGLIFPEGDVDALREHLSNLQNNPTLRDDLSKRGRQRVLDHFTQKQIARKTYGVYQRIMGQVTSNE